MSKTLQISIKAVEEAVQQATSLLSTTFDVAAGGSSCLTVIELANSIRIFLRYCRFVCEVKECKQTIKSITIKYKDIDIKRMRDIMPSSVCVEHLVTVMDEFVRQIGLEVTSPLIDENDKSKQRKMIYFSSKACLKVIDL